MTSERNNFVHDKNQTSHINSANNEKHLPPLIQPWTIKLILLTQVITTWEISTTIDINIMNMY
jgi:hypothetical protein